MFSSLFGSSGSNKADQLRQKAIDAFNSIKTPELSALQVQLDKYVQQGTITPQQAEATLLQSNAFNSIVTDPSLEGAQKQALQQLQEIGTQGGITAVDKAQLNDITNQTNTEARGRRGAILSNARERGVGGSGLEMADSLINEQSAADRASTAGINVAANAQNRALAALQGAGKTATDIRSQSFGEQAAKSEAQNAIDKFNATTSNDANKFNVQTANASQAQNLAEKQRVSDTNTQIGNAEKTYNAQQNQTIYNDELEKAKGIANIQNNAADAAEKANAAEKGADAGMLGGLLQTGGTVIGSIYGGPVGGAVGGAAGKQIGSSFAGGDNEVAPDDYYKKHSTGFSSGGQVSEMNITPDDEADFARFMSEMKSPQKMNCGGMAHYDEGGEVKPTPSPEPKKEEKKEDMGLIERIGALLGSHGDAANSVDPDAPKKGPYDFESRGGKVPGMAVVKGDSPKNDKVPAMLSPGEIVVPRTMAKKVEEGGDDHMIASALQSLINHKEKRG